MTEWIVRNYSEKVLAKLNLTPEDRERFRKCLAPVKSRGETIKGSAGSAGERQARDREEWYLGYDGA